MAVDDSFTKVLLHMNGTDQSITFTDESGKTWTAKTDYTGPAPSPGYASIDTAQKKFGTGSGLFQSTYKYYIETPDHADFYLGDGDFCIDFWFRLASIPAAGTAYRIFWQYVDSSNYFGISIRRDAGDTTTSLFLEVKSGGTAIISLERTITVSIDTWYHAAITRSGNELFAFLNGSLLTPSLSYTSSIPNLSAVVTIGQGGSTRYYDGWIDEFRLSKGVARWSSDFTPPSAAYAPRSSAGETGVFFDYGVM